MYLQWFLASVMITSTNGVTRIFKPDLQALNFAKQIRGRRLNGSVIRQIEVDSDVSCQLQCVEQNGCLSYNFGPYENKKKFKCQLSNSVFLAQRTSQRTMNFSTEEYRYTMS